mmetsp:Transcript_23345/g.34458  ORF Transcript_23345/g.34458 Transcript_23345/m.34458 type:complete len:209 (+) Transcript_23345:85-711(+)
MRLLTTMCFGILTLSAQGKSALRAESEEAHDRRDLLQLSNNQTACDVIRDDLPDECACVEPGRWSVVVECLKEFNGEYFNDTIGMKVVIDPCDPLGSKMAVEVVEKKHEIDYKIAGVRAGEQKNFPIPGLSIIVPVLGHAGLDAAVYIGGNPDLLTLKVGLNACVVVHDKNVCASSIPGVNKILPWWILKGEYSFGHVCRGNSTVAVM